MTAIFQFLQKENYPSLQFKRLNIVNINNSRKRLVAKKRDIGRISSPVRKIILDSGASNTFLPLNLVKKLSLELDPEYNLVLGAIGIGFYQLSLLPVSIELVDDKNNRVRASVLPSFITKIIPRAQIDQTIILESEKKVFVEDDLAEFDLNFNKDNRYVAKISSLKYSKTFKQRFPLCKYAYEKWGLTNKNEILLGRDWQHNFRITFQEKSVIVKQ